MTKIGRLYEEEKIEAVNKAINKTRLEEKKAMAKKMLAKGKDMVEIMEFTELTKDDILKIQADMNLPDVI